MKPRNSTPGVRLLSVLVALGLAAPALAQAVTEPVTQPAIYPTPVSITLDGATVTLGRSVVLVVALARTRPRWRWCAAFSTAPASPRLRPPHACLPRWTARTSCSAPAMRQWCAMR